MGRLEDIVERNKHPRRHQKDKFPLGIGIAVFVLIILILMIFTDLDESPDSQTSAPTPPAQTEKRVDGVLLRSDRPRAPRDAGAAQPVQPAP